MKDKTFDTFFTAGLYFVIGIVVVGLLSFAYFSLLPNYESEFIKNANCQSLKVYIDAGNNGKDSFAHWTYETQETINFKIHQSMVDKAQMKYQWECGV